MYCGRGNVLAVRGRSIAGDGAQHRLIFVDRWTATSVHLHHDLPHSVLGLLFGDHRSGIAHAVGQILALLAEQRVRGPEPPGGVSSHVGTHICLRPSLVFDPWAVSGSRVSHGSPHSPATERLSRDHVLRPKKT